MSEKRMLRLPEILARTGLSRSMIYKMIDDGEFPPFGKAGSASVLLESVLVDWMEKISRGETPRYDRTTGPKGGSPFVWVKMPPGYFDPLPTDEEIDRMLEAHRQRTNEQQAADPDWLPF
jgi:prophage regulatory protein